MSKFFEFHQNNSGGNFDHDVNAGIGYIVIIEAINRDDANYRAERVGLYFDGCDAGVDCECCGDRWYRTSSKGDDVPSSYGQPITDPKNFEYGTWGIPSYIHYMNGDVVVIAPQKSKYS